MNEHGVWRPAMYGGLAGAVLGAMLVIANSTSSRLGVCALQFAAIIACGIGAGLVVAYGPVHSLVWTFGISRPDATWRNPARRVAFLLIVATFGYAMFAARIASQFRLELLLVVWVAAMLLVLQVARPRLSNARGRRWGIAGCEALAALYGPFVIAAVNTLFSDGSNTWMRAECWLYMPLMPGGVIAELTTAAFLHRHPDLSPAALFTLSGLLSGMLVAATTWFAARNRWTRWILLPLATGLCAFGALVVDAVMRM